MNDLAGGHRDQITRPLLFLDVDGTILPLRNSKPFDPDQDWEAWQHGTNLHLANIDLDHGPRLRALDCDLMWATAWMHDANEVISPLLGLPDLPVVELPEWETDYTDDGLHWKTRMLVDVARGRPFAWVDDELTETDQAWVAENYPAATLLRKVDPMSGLTTEDLTAVEEWLDSLD